MKRLIIALTALFCITLSADAMSYEQARDQALFLTDKMAYELNLTEDQYEAAYEINLDYLLSIDDHRDLYGVYWSRRNLDLSYILMDWQYQAYIAANYFYRPLYWNLGSWHFAIYARYPVRTYFYFGCPDFYVSYRGGHSWRMNNGRSWYYGRSYGNGHRKSHGGRGFGMRNGFDRGDFRSHSGNFSRRRDGHLERYDNRERGNGNFRSRGSFEGSRSNGNFNRNFNHNSEDRFRDNPNVRNNGFGSSSSGTFRRGGSGSFGDRSSSTRSMEIREKVNSRGTFSRPNVSRPSTRNNFSAPDRNTFTQSHNDPSPRPSHGGFGGSRGSNNGGSKSKGNFGGQR
ncbi:MAG: hypothetical protein PUH24_08015 [Prevotellaceae bacterium]|nr:hypothetical protein [Prevotella sp.]MDD7258193.1 hypothetical protein [Prevotellaceae bacterium]MDY6130293.1 hypothetical protein [Prevotella sp.]